MFTALKTKKKKTKRKEIILFTYVISSDDGRAKKGRRNEGGLKEKNKEVRLGKKKKMAKDGAHLSRCEVVR